MSEPTRQDYAEFAWWVADYYKSDPTFDRDAQHPPEFRSYREWNTLPAPDAGKRLAARKKRLFAKFMAIQALGTNTPYNPKEQ